VVVQEGLSFIQQRISGLHNAVIRLYRGSVPSFNARPVLSS
jgi:hypothetical protein